MTSPARIVSLVPSLTELVDWLGAAHRLVGRTTFCTEPAALAGRVAAVGGTKNPKLDRIIALRPDLVLANKEENRKEDVEALMAAGINLLVTDPDSVAAAVAMVENLGQLLGCEQRAAALAAETRAEIATGAAGTARRVFVAVWHNPLLGLGSDTYGQDMVTRAGGVNVLAGRPRYPAVTPDELAAFAPDLILLPDEPFPFTEEHRAWYSHVAPARIVDGKLLWWYGPRMPAALRELRAILSEAG